MAAFVRVTMSDCTPGTTGSYVDIDAVTDHGVDADATGVWVRNYLDSGTLRSFDVRKNGSTDEFYDDQYDYCHAIAYVGLDANGIFEAKIESTDLKL